MSIPLAVRSRRSVRAAINSLPMVESLETRQLYSLSLTVVSITPPTTPTATHAKPAKPVKAVKAKPVKAPKVIKLTPKPKPAATKPKSTVSASSGEKHVDYGTSQFT